MSGYDSPIHDPDEDVLGRAAFAHGIARLAADAPVGWGVRIGVYGRWGEGKSSVLNMIARQLREEGHLVAEFNPWGCTTPEEMVELLADTLVATARDEGKKVDGAVGRVAKKGGKALAKVGEAWGGDIEKLTKLLSPWLSRWAKDRKDDIAKVVGVLHEGARLIVLVNDVDRVDPKLLPRLFFALHEVFALPGVSFVLALDPEVVGAALAEYHAGFKSGVDFLAKIVQFPRWLPSPSDEALRRLAERDRLEFASFLKPEVLAQEAKHLPTNPRELRAFIRGLWCLASEIERHDPDEIDQHLLVILEALRQESPAFLSALLDRQNLLNLRAVAFVGDESRTEFEQGVRQLAVEVSTSNDDRAVQLALALCGRSIRWDAEYIRYHADLGERPHAVTWREFRLLRDCANDADRAAWLRDQVQNRRVNETTVVRECLSCCMEAYRKELEEAADARTEEGNQARVERANRILDLLEWLWFHCTSGGEARSPTMFHRVVQAFRAWAHFVLNETDRTLRVRERDLLIAMAKGASAPLDFLEALAPWDPRIEQRREAKALTDALLAEIEGRAAAEVVHAFVRPSGISGCLFGSRVAEKYLLLHREPMWCKEQLDTLAAFIAKASDVVADNCQLLLHAVLDPTRMDLEFQPSGLRAEHELLRLLWSGASAVPVQARFFKELDQLRDGLGQLVQTELPLPAWRERVRAMVEEPMAADSPTDRSPHSEG